MTAELHKSPIRVVVEALAGKPNPTIDQVSELAPLGERIIEALIEHGHLPVPDCGDCGVKEGVQHQSGCTVARCKNCGWQHFGTHSSDCAPRKRKTTVWTGIWPGIWEMREYGIADLNELYSLAAQGLMRWDGDQERWMQETT